MFWRINPPLSVAWCWCVARLIKLMFLEGACQIGQVGHALHCPHHMSAITVHCKEKMALWTGRRPESSALKNTNSAGTWRPWRLGNRAHWPSTGTRDHSCSRPPRAAYWRGSNGQWRAWPSCQSGSRLQETSANERIHTPSLCNAPVKAEEYTQT